MPRMDGTGPNGNGPKTGRGLGQCGIEKETDTRSYSNRNLGEVNQGFRRDFGRCGYGLARFGFGLRQRIGGLFSRRG